MHLSWIDWSLVTVVLTAFVAFAYTTTKHAKSTAGFLAANRLAGRYLLTMAEGMVALAAVGCVGTWQLNYRAGFGAFWWGVPVMPFTLFLTLVGWVIYRYRQTRALTMAQFFEMRYSKRFRVLAGLICWVSGVLNYGIFPALAANFFIYYCGLPSHIAVSGLAIPTFAIVVVFLMALALYFTFVGGQISIIITDFLQGILSNSMLLVVVVVMLVKFPLREVFEGLQIAEPGKSMVNPFDAGDVKGFNPQYFLISLALMPFNRLAWQGSQAYYCSAKSPHEAKMATVLGGFRFLFFNNALLLMPLVAYMIMHHPNHAGTAANVTEMLNGISNEQVRNQMITPLTMTTYMPEGLIGAFAVVMIGAFVSTNDTYLHSWGSIFVQDVLLPFRKKPLNPKKHLLILRLSIVGVAVYAILWSLLATQVMDVYMFFAITGAIWLGGAGVVIVGGLYTSWGTAAGAYAGLLTGAMIASLGFLLTQLKVSWVIECRYLTGQWMYFWATLSAIIMYTGFSLLGKRHRFNMDRLLHRGAYGVPTDQIKPHPPSAAPEKWTWKQALGITAEFTRGDKIIYAISIGQTTLILLWFVVLTLVGWLTDMPAARWADCHRIFFTVWLTTCFPIAFWLGVGGIRDASRFFRALKTTKDDFTDDGTVIK